MYKPSLHRKMCILLYVFLNAKCRMLSLRQIWRIYIYCGLEALYWLVFNNSILVIANLTISNSFTKRDIPNIYRFQLGNIVKMPIKMSLKNIVKFHHLLAKNCSKNCCGIKLCQVVMSSSENVEIRKRKHKKDKYEQVAFFNIIIGKKTTGR